MTKMFWVYFVQFVAWFSELVLLSRFFYPDTEKRENSQRRAVVMIVLILVIMAGCAYLKEYVLTGDLGWLSLWLVYSVYLLFAFFWFHFLYRDKPLNQFFYIALGFSARQAFIQLHILVMKLTGIVNQPWLDTLLSMTEFALVYLVLFFFLRNKKFEKKRDIEGKTFFYFAFLLVALNAVFGIQSNTLDKDSFVYLIFLVSEILVYIFFVLFQLNYLSMIEEKVEKETIKGLLLAEQQQYESFRNAVDYLNVKVHDLKHQMLAVHRADRQGMEELENSIAVYESYSNTNHPALNLILGEKVLVCDRNKIQLVSIVESKNLTMFSESDLFSLIGNALDNAIDYEMTVDEGKRFIRFSVKEFGSMIFMRIENYFEGEIVLKDGLPVTTKEDKTAHGFGVKSMRMTAKKYKGEMIIEQKEGLFCLTFSFPIL